MHSTLPNLAQDIDSAVDAALARIPPLWPLKHFVAVNPFVGLLDLPFAEACALLQRIQGAVPLQSVADYRAAYARGEITRADLSEVGDACWTPERLLAALDQAESEAVPGPLATVADLLDAGLPRGRWSVFVAEEISKWCAVAFDENQTTWTSPWKRQGLYAAWREAACHDKNPEVFGLAGFRAFAAALPRDSRDAIVECLGVLETGAVDRVDFLHRQLATIAGWAGYAQYLAREDALRGATNPVLRDLLAIRLAYDAALHRAFFRDGSLRAEWRHQHVPAVQALQIDARVLWQQAYELGYQRKLGRALAAARAGAPAERARVQAVFCIDVRSEVLRRHFEAALPGAQTVGFAGFFGFPVAHRNPAGGASSRCPVLLVPPVESCEPLDAGQAEASSGEVARSGAWKAFQNSAASCFSFVEGAGLAFGAALARGQGKRGPACSKVAPDLKDATLDTRVSLAAGALKNMGLTQAFARLVLICGHGSTSANNPYASGLDCGACGGHAGDVNARLAAATLNDPAVRTRLVEQGLAIPTDTFFLAGLHNTTTDDVALFDLERLPHTHLVDLVNLRRGLALAGAATRRERAAGLGLAPNLPDSALDAAVRGRATDVSQVRPEWGLANNAALVAAPRWRTAGFKLDGRVFLHDYDAGSDLGDKVLTLILCAPVVVASWINLQYYASRVNPLLYGSGNKVLHNVVGGVGVVEGNGGDLKVGLPLQSIHDGERWMHEPRRLTVYIEAGRDRIEGVLQAHPEVRRLFDHGWIHLAAIEGDRTWRRRDGDWRPL